jgi:hypothetical protein
MTPTQQILCTSTAFSKEAGVSGEFGADMRMGLQDVSEKVNKFAL